MPRALLVLVLVALVVIPAATAWACGPNRAITLDKFSYLPGETVQVNGANFEPGAQVNIRVDGNLATTATGSPSGFISASFPAPSKPGTHLVTTDGVDSQGQVFPGTGNAVTFSVEAVPSGPSAGGGARSYPTPRPAPTLAGCAPGKRLLSLTTGNDRRAGTVGNDLILARAGNDRIDARAGDDCVDLGLGDDRGQGGAGNDLVLGGEGIDRILGGFGNDTLDGQAGRDRVVGGSGRDRINGGGGRDLLGGGSGRDRISGRGGGDRIAGGRGNDVLRGGSGNDTISGSSGRDRISCGRGTDRVSSDGRDVVAGDCERVRRPRG